MKGYLLLAALLAAVSFSASAVRAEADLQYTNSRHGTTGAEESSGGLKAFFESFAQKSAKKKPVEDVSYTYAWVDARPPAKGDAEWACLAEALYFEARGETVKGQFAVAEVIRNRVESSQFPNTYCSVIRQGTGKRYQCQFSYNCDGNKNVIAEKQAYQRVSKIARAVLDGVAGNVTGGAMYYHNTTVRPRWARRFTETARIGVHIFYRPKLRTASNG